MTEEETGKRVLRWKKQNKIMSRVMIKIQMEEGLSLMGMRPADLIQGEVLDLVFSVVRRKGGHHRKSFLAEVSSDVSWPFGSCLNPRRGCLLCLQIDIACDKRRCKP